MRPVCSWIQPRYIPDGLEGLRKGQILESCFSGVLDDRIAIEVWCMLYRFSGAIAQYMHHLKSSPSTFPGLQRLCWRGWGSCRSTQTIIWPHGAVREPESNGGVKEVFLAPPLKSYSPCHLPLVIIKENIIIVSTFGGVSVQRGSVSSWRSYLLPYSL